MFEIALSTFDNPFNPLKNFESWFNYDLQKGYNTCQLLARVAKTSDQLSEEENAEEIERAIDEIIKYSFAIDKEGNVIQYIKVKEQVKS